MGDIQVSIICNAYNHGKYIRDALEGFVTQKTNFLFEILVHDDASTDNTAEIIREYEEKYPELIKPIYQTENQHSKGLGIFRNFQEPRVKGRYIAVCEGDDYWIDPLKLQKQYDAMEAHPEVDICAHTAIKVDAATGKEISYIRPVNNSVVLSTEDVILGGGGYVATASLFYRTEITKNPPEFRKFMYLDYTLQVSGALRGGMLYLDECMSAYRFRSAGSWTVRMSQNPSRRDLHHERVKTMLGIMNEETNRKYEAIIKTKLHKSEFDFLRNSGRYKEATSKVYKDVFAKLPYKQRMAIRIKAMFPFISKVK